MRWKGRAKSSNIEDRRGSAGGSGNRRRSGGGMKIGGIGFVVMILIYLFTGQGQNFMDMMGEGSSAGSGTLSNSSQGNTNSGTDTGGDFVKVIVKDTENVWNPIFQSRGVRYEEPTVVLFTDQVSSACGMTSSATGPFYCPGDKKVYLDLGFFSQLRQMGVAGDFAQAYVIAHEIGHHVQKIQGISDEVMQRQRRTNKVEANKLSVLLELQADCYAGIWAREQAKFNRLEDGDLEEALNAAASIGDDRMQKRAGQYVNPDGFTHGSSAQRVEWLKRGMVSGDPGDCNTFAGMR